MAFTVIYLLVIVLVPLLTLPVKSFSEGWSFFWDTIRDPRVIASYRLTLGASFAAANLTGERRLLELAERLGAEGLGAGMGEILSYSERRTRAALEALRLATVTT